ncbi:MAG TPA: peptidoglycan bridge formation glycyltransferase FemA/FemB family protein [Cellulomonas sp.]
MPATPTPLVTAAAEVDDREAWDDLVLGLGGHPLQLWGWGEVKAEGSWTPRRIVVRDGDGAPIGAAQVLVRHLPWPMRASSYVPRGPVVAGHADRDAVVAAVVAWTRRHVGGVGISMEPGWPAGAGLPAVPGLRRGPVQVLVPVTLVLDLTRSDEELLSAMSKTTRKQVRRAERAGVTYREVEDGEVEACLSIYHQVAARAGFPLHTDAYYRSVREHLGEHSPVVAAFVDDEPVAFLWFAVSARTSFELYGGATDAGQEVHANFGLKWAAIAAMRSRGVTEYDMNGLLNDGVSQFKRSFADHEDVFVGPLDVPFSPAYHLLVRGVPVAKRLLRTLRRR